MSFASYKKGVDLLDSFQSLSEEKHQKGELQQCFFSGPEQFDRLTSTLRQNAGLQILVLTELNVILRRSQTVEGSLQAILDCLLGLVAIKQITINITFMGERPPIGLISKFATFSYEFNASYPNDRVCELKNELTQRPVEYKTFFDETLSPELQRYEKQLMSEPSIRDCCRIL